jgi:hypothetical protein
VKQHRCSDGIKVFDQITSFGGERIGNRDCCALHIVDPFQFEWRFTIRADLFTQFMVECLTQVLMAGKQLILDYVDTPLHLGIITLQCICVAGPATFAEHRFGEPVDPASSRKRRAATARVLDLG